jgi:hypothetical protein
MEMALFVLFCQISFEAELSHQQENCRPTAKVSDNCISVCVSSNDVNYSYLHCLTAQFDDITYLTDQSRYYQLIGDLC